MMHRPIGIQYAYVQYLGQIRHVNPPEPDTPTS